MNFSDADIAKYYDVSRQHYNIFWQLKKNKSLHYGYWDHTTRNFSEALIKINEVMAKEAGIKNGMRILDTGCGDGGSVAWIAGHFDCEVTGITLSKRQQAVGYTFLQQKGLPNASIEVQNYLHTTFPDGHFDVVWAIESVCHAPDKSAYLREMYRILKPGGKIILADFFIAKTLNAKEQQAINNWAFAWAVPAFEQKDEFLTKATEAGFQKVQARDITQHIVKSAKRLYRLFFLGLPVAVVYNLFYPKVSKAGKANVYSAYWQYITLKKKLWNYQLVSIEK